MTDEDQRHLVQRPADQIKMRIPKWLWEKRIPIGHMTLLAGREGIGKSSIAIMLAAKLTKGELEGKYLGQPRGVAIVATEDDWASTIVPRLVAASADLSRIHQIEAHREGGMETISVPKDVAQLGALASELELAMLILDPVMSVLPGNIDTHKDKEVRSALEPVVKRFAIPTGCSVIGLIHVNKQSNTDPLNTIMASRAFTALSRSVLYCSADPDDDDTYLLGHVKSNLGPKMDTVSYRLVDTKIEIADEDGHVENVSMSRAVLGDTDDRSIADLMQDRTVSAREGELSKQLVALVDAASGVVTMTQIKEAFPDERENKLSNYLSRLVQRARIDRPSAGVFQSKRLRPKVSDSALPHTSPPRQNRGVSVVSDGNTPDPTVPTFPHTREVVWGDDWPAVPPPEDWD